MSLFRIFSESRNLPLGPLCTFPAVFVPYGGALPHVVDVFREESSPFRVDARTTLATTDAQNSQDHLSSP